MVEWTSGWSYTREAWTVQSLQCLQYDGGGLGGKNYIDTKHVAKHAVWLAKSGTEKEVFAAIFPDGDGVFHIAKQMNRTNHDVVSDNCVRNDVGQWCHYTSCACGGSTRSVVASLSNWWPLQTMSVAGVRVRLGLSLAELWMSMAPCLMWKPLSTTYVISCTPVPLLPDVVWPGESSGYSCLF